jgi:hypothetical protein
VHVEDACEDDIHNNSKTMRNQRLQSYKENVENKDNEINGTESPLVLSVNSPTEIISSDSELF